MAEEIKLTSMKEGLLIDVSQTSWKVCCDNISQKIINLVSRYKTSFMANLRTLNLKMILLFPR